MANEQELTGKNEYFEYVETRIENLEKLISLLSAAKALLTSSSENI